MIIQVIIVSEKKYNKHDVGDEVFVIPNNGKYRGPDGQVV